MQSQKKKCMKTINHGIDLFCTSKSFFCIKVVYTWSGFTGSGNFPRHMQT